MNQRTAIYVALSLAVAAGCWLFYRDYEYRQIHGRVVEVGLLNWEQEVEQSKENLPVLVYFYKENEKTPADARQNSEVSSFAWHNAGKVKVVAVNSAHLENLPLVVAHGSLRIPAFAILHGSKVIEGPSGVFTTSEELTRLLQLLNQKQ